MEQPSETAAAALHLSNNPPSDLELFMEQVREDAADLLARQAELEMKACLLPEAVKSDDDLARVNAVVQLFRDLERDAEGLREKHNRPILERQRALNGFVKADMIEPLEKRRKGMTARTTAYLQAKEAERRAELQRQAAERAAAEEAARAAAQAALEEGRVQDADEHLKAAATDARVAAASEKAATAPAPDLARTTAGGVTSTLATKWQFRITDPKALRASLGVLGEHFTSSELEKAIRAAVKAGVRDTPAGEGIPGKAAIPGVYIFPETTARSAKARGASAEAGDTSENDGASA